MEGRIDVFYYQTSFTFLVNKLTIGKYPFLSLNKLSKITDGSHLSPPSDSNFNKKYITVKDLDNFGNIDFVNCLTISEKEFNKLVKSGCQPKFNDVLFSKDGTIGKTCTVTDFTDFVVLSSLAIITPDTDLILSRYLEFILKTEFVLKLIKRLMGGTAIQRIVLLNLKLLKIPVPPLDIQHQIVAIFENAYQTKQQKQQEAKDLLNSIDSYLLGELGINLPTKEVSKPIFYTKHNKVKGGRLDPHFNKPEYSILLEQLKQIQYPLIPLKKLNRKIFSGMTPLSGGDAYTNKEDGVLFLRSGDYTENNTIYFDDLIYLKKEVHHGLMKHSQLQKNDLLIAIVGATIGKVGIYNYDIPANINQAICAVRLNENMNPLYAQSYLLSSVGQKILDMVKRPVARANINLDEIGSLYILVPPLDIQDRIAAYIQGIREQAQRLEQEAMQVVEEAKGIIEKMILGE